MANQNRAFGLDLIRVSLVAAEIHMPWGYNKLLTR